MDIIIRPLSRELTEDYFQFFENVAFSDHEEWAGCYCLFYHIDPAQEESGSFDEMERRALAEKMISEGTLRGYLAYADGKTVGWCNTGVKQGYKRLCANKELRLDGEDDKIKSIVCFLIAPDMRQKGIAAKLLDRVCEDAAAEGFACVEAYPATGTLDSFKHYHGPGAMYEKAGFKPVKTLHGFSVVRKEL